jgi:hypothetical protein
MAKVIFYRWFFNILLKGQIFGDVPFDHSLHIPCSPCKNLETRTWRMYAVSIATLLWPACLNPSFHTKSTFKKGDYANFWILMDWDNGVHPMLWTLKE